MSNPPRREADPHATFMREMRDHLRANNKQVAALTASMTEMTAKLSEFVTAVEVMRVTQEQHARAIDGLEARELAREKTASEHRFTLSNNIVFWAIGGIGVAFSLVNFLGFLIQHWR